MLKFNLISFLILIFFSQTAMSQGNNATSITSTSRSVIPTTISSASSTSTSSPPFTRTSTTTSTSLTLDSSTSSPSSSSSSSTSNPGATNDIPKGSSSSFQLGTAGTAGIVVVAIAIVFAAIAIFVVRQRNKKKGLPEDSMLDLEELSTHRKPLPAAPGSRGVPLIMTFDGQTAERKAMPPSQQFMYYSAQHQNESNAQQQTESNAQHQTDHRYSQQTLQTFDEYQQDQSQYPQQQIDQWNAQIAAGIYTQEQINDWCDRLRGEGYTEEDILQWKSQQILYTQEQIDEWYAATHNGSDEQQILDSQNQ